MLWGVEIVMTLLGLYMLIIGQTFGKEPVRHWHTRLLGLFILSFWPVTLIVGLVAVVAWAILHPGAQIDPMPDTLTTITRAIEIGMVLIYMLGWMLLEKRIRAVAQARAAAAAVSPAPIEA